MSHHNATLNFSHAPYKNKASLSELDREIEMGELRLRYIQLMWDVHKTLGKEDAIELIKESEGIWEKLTSWLGFSARETYEFIFFNPLDSYL